MFSTDGQQHGEENQTPTASKKIRYHGTFSVYFVHVLSLDPVAYVTCMSEVNQDYQLLQTEKKKQDISRGFLFHYHLLVYFLVFWRSEVYNLVCNHADLDCWFLFPLLDWQMVIFKPVTWRSCVQSLRNVAASLSWSESLTLMVFICTVFLIYWENAICLFCSVVWRMW